MGCTQVLFVQFRSALPVDSQIALPTDTRFYQHKGSNRTPTMAPSASTAVQISRCCTHSSLMSWNMLVAWTEWYPDCTPS